METKRSWGRSITIACALFLSAFAWNGCDDSDDMEANYTISGNATGAQVVPAVTTTATGTITGSYNPNTRVLTYTSNWNGLSGAPVSVAFYDGAVGSTGTMEGTAWALGAGATATGTFSGSMTLTEEQEDELLNGEWYYSYYTTTNPNGEIRGQITATR